jgi:hypothetical protein
MKESIGILLWLLTTMVVTAVVVSITYLAVGIISLALLVTTLIYEGAMVAAVWAFYTYILVEEKK